jgi:hypothetical protein
MKKALVSYNTLLCARVEEILEKFNRSNVPVILLKGIALLHDTYEDPGERAMGDVDILIRPEDLEKTKSILIGNGFSFVHGNMSNAVVYGIKAPFEMYIDLHWSLANPRSPSQPKIYAPNEAVIWNRAAPIRFGQQKAFTLCPEDRVVYLCFHALKERFSSDKWLRDLSLLIQKKRKEINKEDFIRTAKKSGTLKLCSMIIDYLSATNKCNVHLFRDDRLEDEFSLYRGESALFRFLLKQKLYPLREALWIISMDSAGKKAEFLKNLISYIPRKIFKIKYE